MKKYASYSLRFYKNHWIQKSLVTSCMKTVIKELIFFSNTNVVKLSGCLCSKGVKRKDVQRLQCASIESLGAVTVRLWSVKHVQERLPNITTSLAVSEGWSTSQSSARLVRAKVAVITIGRMRGYRWTLRMVTLLHFFMNKPEQKWPEQLEACNKPCKIAADFAEKIQIR